MNFDRTSKHSVSCILENDQIGNLVYAALFDDDSEATDGPDSDFCSTANQNFFIAVAFKAEFISPVCTLHTIHFITPLFIDLPPPSATLVRVCL